MNSFFFHLRMFALSLAVCLFIAWSPLAFSQPTAQTFDHIAAYAAISETNPSLKARDIWRLLAAVDSASQRTGVAPERLLAIIDDESKFDAAAVSRAGARGPTQVLSRYHADKLDEAQALYGSRDLHKVNVGVYVGARVFQEYAEGRSVKAALNRYSGGHVGYASRVLKKERQYRALIYPAPGSREPVHLAMR